MSKLYSDKEIEFVIKNYGINTAQELADVLGRTLSSIIGLIVRLRGVGINLSSTLSNSETALEKRSKKMMELWKNPEYLKKMEYKAEKASEYMKENNPMKSEENREIKRKIMINNWKDDEFIKRHSNNGHDMWVGDKIGYQGLHGYMRKYKEKSERCEHCNEIKKLDLANVSGEYKRDVNDFIWLCRKCHIAYDMSKSKMMEINA